MENAIEHIMNYPEDQDNAILGPEQPALARNQVPPNFEVLVAKLQNEGFPASDAEIALRA